MKITTHIPMEGLINARHLGGYRAGNMLTSDKAYIRCENPDKLTRRDMDVLYDFGIRTVIDLRSPEEVAQSENPLSRDSRFDYHSIPVFSADASPEALAQKKIDMGQLYIYMADHCTDSFFQIFDTILHSHGGVLFHCTAGKDRTGVLAAILLLACGVAKDDVVWEYTFTEELLRPLVEQLENNVPKGMEKENVQAMLAAKPEYISVFVDHLNYTYHGAKGYLAHLGFSQEEITALCQRLVNDKEGVA
ncbi:tyrosine-protein phosphatase [Massiliimalia massiliensis]|uniref:tyrosine-protein phosphatase n=1 Tax=Massiliimalia massiliensis TaxID=1852384 RepID=UPI0009857036|nr:tyrosine-protein phosphatase [Massiliimalia massiliensis]